MNKNTKIWLIIATSLILVGLIIFGGVMTVLKWDFKKLSNVKYETNNHIIKEEFKSITIETDTADIEFLVSEKGDTRVECYEYSNVKHSVTVSDGTLEIKAVDTRKWYEHIGIIFGTPKLRVYIPEGAYGKLEIRSSTGDVKLTEGFGFESIDIKDSTGSVTSFATSNGPIKIKTTTGGIHVENAYATSLDLSVSTGEVKVQNVTCKGDLKIKVSTGKTVLNDVKCESLITSGSTGNMMLTGVFATEKFTIERSTGDVKFEKCDAAEIFVETDTGNVKGSLLSDKVFITSTDTGKIDVPKSVTGGRCEINTDTGNIKITVK